MPAVPPTPEALHPLVTSIPAKTLHAYLLDNIPAAPPETLAIFASFFMTLSPSSLLYYVQCHKDYTDIKNSDCSCCVPHDDNSAEVKWAGHKHSNSNYETYYGCCGKTVEGKGDLGPPDGWCYKGMHMVSQVKLITQLPISLLATPGVENYNSYMLISTPSLCCTTDGHKTCMIPHGFNKRR